MSFYNLFVTIRSVDQQSKLFAKDVDFAQQPEYTGVDKLLDYLRRDTKDVNQVK